MEEPTEIGDWQKVLILGSGSFGVVTLWRNKATQDTVAVKKCRWHTPEKISDKQRKRWKQEVEFMRSMHHENIVAYKMLPHILELELNKHNLSNLPLLSMEYCTKGNLRHCLVQPKNSCGMPEREVRYILKDISGAISYLHKLKIMHRDLKPENIVLQKSDIRPNEIIYKLIDLGYAKDMDSTIASHVGTLQYLAPEIFISHDYSNTVDYWSFGVIVYEIICGIHPFLPKLSPVQRIEHISKKSPNDICIYTSRSGEIIYSSEIIKENHISSCLKKHCENWLRIVLKYDPKERGVTGSNRNVFEELDFILNKKIISVFSVFNYEYYYYEVDESTLLESVFEWLQKDTQIARCDQLLITDNMYYDDKADRKLLECLDELNANTMLVLFKKSAFIETTQANLPTEVKTLIKNVDKQYTWESLYVQMAHTVHYILRETKLMCSFKKAFQIEFDYVKNLFKNECKIFQSLISVANKLLIEIEFCKNMNSDIKYIASNDLNLECVKKYRRHLWQSKEVIENVNSAASRHAKLQSREKVLKLSSKRIEDNLDKVKTDEIYSNALACLNSTKHKAPLSSKDIIKALSSCLKGRSSLISDQSIEQHVLICSNILREINRLIKWMSALKLQIEKLSYDICLSQKDVFLNFSQQKAQRNTEIFSNDDFTFSEASLEDLLDANKNLRCGIQEVLNKLLITYKQQIKEVQSFDDNISYETEI